jgi:hypothetical protein
MSLKQNILKEFDEKFGEFWNDRKERFEPTIFCELNCYENVKDYIESKLSLIEQEVMKCVGSIKSVGELKEEMPDVYNGEYSLMVADKEGYNRHCRGTSEALDNLFN